MVKSGVFTRYFYALFAVTWFALTLFSAQVLAVHSAPATISFSSAVYLNPNTGRFWTMDSFEGLNFDPPTLHKYNYVEGNPVDKNDFSGNLSTSELLVYIDIESTEKSFEAQSKVPKISMARKVVAAITAAAVGVSTIEAPKGVPYAMRLQLQKGSALAGGKHYWSRTMTALGYPGVRKTQVWNALLDMWKEMSTGTRIDLTWDVFPFNSWARELRSATIEMSKWVGTHGPTPPYPDPLLHQEYLDPTDDDEPRIDLENLRGENIGSR